MRVAITGATGNLGTSLVRALVDDPRVDSIVGIARRTPDWQPPRTTWIPADVRNAPLDRVFRGVDAVVHLAWIFQPTHDPLATWDNNVRGAQRVFAAAAESRAGVLVHASSVGAYRDVRHHDRVDETWPTDALPTVAYGREKSYLERVLDRVEVDDPGMRVVRMRPCFLFKRESASAQRRLFAGPLLPTAVLRRPVPLVPVPRGLEFQAMHTDDAAEAIRLALHEDVRGPLNLATDAPLTPHDLAAALGGRHLPFPMRAVRVAVSGAWHARALPASPQLIDLVDGLPLLDSTRARVELGWSPTRSGRDALDALVDGLRRRASFPTPPLAPDRPGRWDEVASGAGAVPSPAA